jgi:hypothetical protein
MDVVDQGFGGIAKVVEVLKEKFQAGIAVAVFRVTAVDDRGVTVSYRTKIIHVIWTGPNVPRMQKAKVASYNSVFKAPFTSNLQLQTDDITDINPAAIEKALRSSGGAHAPTGYDFTNTAFKTAA